MRILGLVVSVFLIAIGLLVGLVIDVPADIRLFGWILVGVGVLGLASRWWMARPVR
jgi:hypothetical protein